MRFINTSTIEYIATDYSKRVINYILFVNFDVTAVCLDCKVYDTYTEYAYKILCFL